MTSKFIYTTIILQLACVNRSVQIHEKAVPVRGKDDNVIGSVEDQLCMWGEHISELVYSPVQGDQGLESINILPLRMGM
jgi:hypothetical protein